MKQIKYTPFAGVRNYSLRYREEIPHSLYFKGDSKSESFELIIKPKGFIPKSGLFLCKAIEKLVKNKIILEIGTGETGIISIFSSKHGAKEVTAVDIDRNAVKWARYNGASNKVDNTLWLKSDKFEKVSGKFDLIICNPPQMPMLKGSLHDSGGKNGRETIDRIIKDSTKYLYDNGSLILLVFDFLSVTKKYGNNETLFELLKKNGFKPSVIASTKRLVRPGGETFKSLKHISKVYPDYRFLVDGKGNLYYKMLVVKADLV